MTHHHPAREEVAPPAITYNPVYDMTYIGERPEQGFVYRLSALSVPDAGVREALRRVVDALVEHHQWHAAQTDPDPEYGFIPADEYADSALYERTVEALGVANPLLANGPVNSASPEAIADVPGGSGEADDLGRTPAQFFFEVGYGACWADAYIKAGEVAPFPMTDATVERAWQIAGEAYEDPAEFDRMLARANGSALSPSPAPEAGLVEAAHCTCMEVYGEDPDCPKHGVVAEIEQAGHKVAMAAGSLVIATDGEERLRHHRQSVLDALNEWAALSKHSGGER